jgi:hypothetical protein
VSIAPTWVLINTDNTVIMHVTCMWEGSCCPTGTSRLFAVLHRAGIATAGVRFPVEARYFSLLQSVQTGSGSHPASYPVSTGGLRGRGMKLTSHLHPVSRSGMVELYHHSPYVFMSWSLIN